MMSSTMKRLRATVVVLLALPMVVWAASAEINYDMEPFEADLENKTIESRPPDQPGGFFVATIGQKLNGGIDSDERTGNACCR